MENLSTVENTVSSSEKTLLITEKVKNDLLASMKWLKYFAVLGVISMVFMVILGLVFLVVDMPSNGIPSAALGALYIILAGVYYYPISKTFAQIKNTREALTFDSQMSLEEASSNYYSVLRYLGILSITLLCLYVIVFVGAIICAVLANIIA
ncbi:MAG: hypothetical protein IKV67_00855 [Paludibacteraceae bacterium]|nr:hypothetical protein [Paludibacteraceae bacterium]